MHLHPEAPSYEQQIMAQDHILERYPKLIFVGAHYGSMEWNLEELAKRLDKFPNFYVDISGRFEHCFEQTFRNRNMVIDFFKTYSNRILYGSDYFVSYNKQKWMNLFCKCFPKTYMSLLFNYIYIQIVKKHWLFLSTDKVIKTGRINNKPESPKHIEGLRLSKSIVDHIFCESTRHIYFRK